MCTYVYMYMHIYVCFCLFVKQKHIYVTYKYRHIYIKIYICVCVCLFIKQVSAAAGTLATLASTSSTPLLSKVAGRCPTVIVDVLIPVMCCACDAISRYSRFHHRWLGYVLMECMLETAHSQHAHNSGGMVGSLLSE